MFVVAGVLLAGAAHAASEPEAVLSAVVGVKSEVPPTARTADFLGTERSGSGVVIDSDGLVVTIGYLILEASAAWVVGPEGRSVPAQIIAYDYDTGFGLLRARRPLGVQPLTFGDSKKLGVGDPVLVASRDGPPAVQPVHVIARRDFATYWEYLLENAIVTAPPHRRFGGAALINSEGRLVGIGSLMLREAPGPGRGRPGNLFVPIDRLTPILPDLLAYGRSSAPPKPWIGVFTEEARGHLFVTLLAEEGPAAEAGLEPGDIILQVAGAGVTTQVDFYRRIWALGPAGVDVPLTVIHGTEVRNVTVRSRDRYDWFKIEPSY